jgi:hypothetical protein
MDLPPTQPAGSTNQAPRVPDHDLIRLVGRGSYGEVWLARSLTGTYRAVKIVSRSAFPEERPYEREFEGIQKFEPISRTHPAFMSILHVGRNQDAGYFYYVMEVADDLTLGRQINPGQYQPRTLSRLLEKHAALPLEECLRIGISLSAALGHLHKHGLVHRDIKPSNIIFVEGAPKFADIGLVTDIGEKITFVGTEGYLPPEGPGSPAADLYALGKVLYEISMGKDRLQFPELPAGLRDFKHARHLLQLNEILLKTCDPRPKNRYSSAEALRAALQSLLRDCARETRGPSQGQVAPGSLGRSLKVTILHAPAAEADARLARLLEDKFSAAGHEVFVDEPTLLNLEWGRLIELQIRASDAVIALLSPLSMQDEHMAYALEIASQTARQHKGQPKLLPVRVQCRSPFPRHIEVALGSRLVLAWDAPEYELGWLEELNRVVCASD